MNNPRVTPERQDEIKRELLAAYRMSGRTNRLLFEAADCIGSLQYDVIEARAVRETLMQKAKRYAAKELEYRAQIGEKKT